MGSWDLKWNERGTQGSLGDRKVIWLCSVKQIMRLRPGPDDGVKDQNPSESQQFNQTQHVVEKGEEFRLWNQISEHNIWSSRVMPEERTQVKGPI